MREQEGVVSAAHNLADAPYDGSQLLLALEHAVARFRFTPNDQQRMLVACRHFRTVLDDLDGSTLQARWQRFEEQLWPAWVANHNRPPAYRWTWGARALVTARLVRPSWPFLREIRVSQWVARLAADDPLTEQALVLGQALKRVSWTSPFTQGLAVNIGLRMLLWRGYTSVQMITEDDLRAIPSGGAKGMDALDAALCALGVFARTPQRSATRSLRHYRQSVAELVEHAAIPPAFQEVTRLYLESYATRISDTHATIQHKLIAIGHFWRFMGERYPDIQRCRDIVPQHARAFITYAIERAQQVQRGSKQAGEIRVTAHAWLLDVRTFFADVCTWAVEADSPFAQYAPTTIPLTRHDLVGIGFDKARKQQAARLTATVLDLEREMPKIRAYAFQCWSEARDACTSQPDSTAAQKVYREAFWDWALLELLVQSGLRIEEAAALTTLDILKRALPDGRVYYLLHVKPSKFDRARVIPIGDSLGRVIAEIIRHVKQFYGTTAVPCCRPWNSKAKEFLPPAPYLLQGANHPSAIGVTTIRARLRKLSRAAGAQCADGSPLDLHPHDCRRVFASEHLNNNTPVHVIQALLGHATINTVMVYAKLYPTHLVEEYRKAVRERYVAIHGEESLRNPTLEEWQAFVLNCSLRDMGTHLCALPTGEHCPKGLICLGCSHAQPKKSAAPVFRRMVASHERALAAAKARGEPAGQLAVREMEVIRLHNALRRAEELTEDVAAAIEGAA